MTITNRSLTRDLFGFGRPTHPSISLPPRTNMSMRHRVVGLAPLAFIARSLRLGSCNCASRREGTAVSACPVPFRQTLAAWMLVRLSFQGVLWRMWCAQATWSSHVSRYSVKSMHHAYTPPCLSRPSSRTVDSGSASGLPCLPSCPSMSVALYHTRSGRSGAEASKLVTAAEARLYTSHSLQLYKYIMCLRRYAPHQHPGKPLNADNLPGT